MRYFAVMHNGNAVTCISGESEEQARKSFEAEWGQSRLWRARYQEWVQDGAVLAEVKEGHGANNRQTPPT